MKPSNTDILGKALRDYFMSYLPQIRGMSPHTIMSYRDSIKLLIQFVMNEKGIAVSNLTVDSLGVDTIIEFLHHLESKRLCGPGTRNIRLSAFHSFFRYLAGKYPEILIQCQQILSIPFKRTVTRTIEYLDFEEVKAVLACIDRSKSDGRRDYMVILLMFNTGARVQEIVNLKANDLQLLQPYSVSFFGKGSKERICPIWKDVAQLLHEYINEHAIDIRKPQPLFLNRLNKPLTRFGIRYILAKYLKRAVHIRPSLDKKRLHPHSMRHSTAVHLLKSGVDLSSIAHLMGHASINTTNKYTSIDLKTKEQILENIKHLPTMKKTKPSWKKDKNILQWLESL